MSVPNPVLGNHDAFCEPFDVSVGRERAVEVGLGPGLGLPKMASLSQDSLLEDDFPDTQRILAVK